jgi:hypothetical protein
MLRARRITISADLIRHSRDIFVFPYYLFYAQDAEQQRYQDQQIQDHIIGVLFFVEEVPDDHGRDVGADDVIKDHDQ